MRLGRRMAEIVQARAIRRMERICRLRIHRECHGYARADSLNAWQCYGTTIWEGHTSPRN